jgi:hypothetical protein
MADEATLLNNLNKKMTELGQDLENLGKELKKKLDKLEDELEKSIIQGFKSLPNI